VLLREIHHRVKNNLQITRACSIPSGHLVDQHDQEIFKESQTGIQSMALITEALWLQRLGKIGFPNTFAIWPTICSDRMGKSDAIALEITAATSPWTSDTAVRAV